MTDCCSTYSDHDTYITYYCTLRDGHCGPHEDVKGPGMRWYS